MNDDLSEFSPSRKRIPRFRLGISGLAWELLLMTLVYGVPRVRAIYSDYGIDLARYTILVIRSSDWVIAHAPMLLVLLGAVWIMQDALAARGETMVSRTRTVLMLACPALLLALTLIALGAPILSINHRLNG